MLRARKKILTAWLSVELVAALDAEAQRLERSRSSVMERILRAAVGPSRGVAKKISRRA